MTNAGKLRYDAIPIPETLDSVIYEAVKKGARRSAEIMTIRWLSAAAAVFAIFFACANIAPVYAFAENIPVIGQIVQVLHVGTGGEITDGAAASSESLGETVEIKFESAEGAVGDVPFYEVTRALAPNRVYITLSGVRTIDYESIEKSLMSTKAVKEVYLSMIGDDSMFGFVVVMNGGYDYEITEYADPASLSIRFFEDSAYDSGKTVWYLRSDAMEYGEELMAESEMFYMYGATQLRTADGSFIVTVGQYETEAEAKAALAGIESDLGGASGLYAASGTADEIPEK